MMFCSLLHLLLQFGPCSQGAAFVSGVHIRTVLVYAPLSVPAHFEAMSMGPKLHPQCYPQVSKEDAVMSVEVVDVLV